MPRPKASWAVADAKAHFSELIDRVLAAGPQVITRKGKEAVVVVSVEEWKRKSRRKGNLAEFFAASPLRNSGLDLERVRSTPRDLSL